MKRRRDAAHLRAVGPEEVVQRDPRDPVVWRRGIEAARDALEATSRPAPPPRPPIQLVPCQVCRLPTSRVDEDGLPFCAECQRVEALEESEPIDLTELGAARQRHPARPRIGDEDEPPEAR
ncbi:MAG TPA: hypothetical protein VFA11_10085 [Acidimicrobiales bacterium]|nr:hypothetical protein [Acidimicrobiales bacterium]